MILAGTMGFSAVALGAFGAHGLKAKLGDLPDYAQRMDWWQTAAHYHLVHAVALFASAYMIQRGTGTPAIVAGVGFCAGVVLFSGSLYVMTLTGMKTLGAVTPLGGLCFLIGWGAIIAAAVKLN